MVLKKETKDVERQMAESYPTVDQDDNRELEQAWDDVTVAELNPSMVKQARQEEIQYVREMGLYRKVSRA